MSPLNQSGMNGASRDYPALPAVLGSAETNDDLARQDDGQDHAAEGAAVSARSPSWHSAFWSGE
jgi:hypothetical protein